MSGGYLLNSPSRRLPDAGHLLDSLHWLLAAREFKSALSSTGCSDSTTCRSLGSKRVKLKQPPAPTSGCWLLNSSSRRFPDAGHLFNILEPAHQCAALSPPAAHTDTVVFACSLGSKRVELKQPPVPTYGGWLLNSPSRRFPDAGHRNLFATPPAIERLQQRPQSPASSLKTGHSGQVFVSPLGRQTSVRPHAKHPMCSPGLCR